MYETLFPFVVALVVFFGPPSATAQTTAPTSGFSIDGFALGSRIQADSRPYKEFRCEPSEQYPAHSWCHRSQSEHSPRGAFRSERSILHSQEGQVLYVNKYLEPAFWNPNEVASGMAELSKKFGKQPTNVVRMPQISGEPDGVMATWGDVILEHLDKESIDTLSTGKSPAKGILVDFIGNFQRSAKKGLPIYRLAGGPGYVWTASFNKRRRGTLRFFAIDPASLLGSTASKSPSLGASQERSTSPGVPLEADKTLAAPQVTELRPQEGNGRHRWALVIGNSMYKSVARLPNPVRDADLISDSLLAAGFDVLKGVDLDRSQTFELVKVFIEHLSSGDVGVVYYSGHALEVNGINYMLPIDIDITLTKETLASIGFPINDLLALMESAVGTRVIFLDACRDNPFSSNRRGISGLAEIPLATGGSFIAYATSPGGVAADGEGQHSPFAEALAKALRVPGLEIDDLLREVRRDVYESTKGSQRPWSNSSLLTRFYFLPPPISASTMPTAPAQVVETPADSRVIAIDEDLINALGLGTVRVNGLATGTLGAQGLAFRGVDFETIIRRGTNVIENERRRARVWYENMRLELLSEPYRTSFAVVAAIDKYGETGGKTGYRDLGFMVDGAKELVSQLVQLGFARDNIIELYNDRATLENIHEALKEFWPGGRYENADRVVFYFGGHGDTLPKPINTEIASPLRGVLIPYDFSKKRAFQSGLLLDEVIGQQFEYTSARQFLVLLDACSSGLALPRHQSDGGDAEQLRRLHRLSAIKSETSRPSRAILVAGTGAEEALWVNGGLFTKVLIDALKGAADWTKDGIIFFEELLLQVREEVHFRARRIAGVDQLPDGYSNGTGKFMFLMPEKPSGSK
jgi:uncharacterized caspase-like protein